MKQFTFVFFLTLLTFINSPAQAHPLDPNQKSNPSLIEQMDKMILSVADLDILVNRDKVMDYEIMTEDAKRILDAVKNIRAIDKNGVFKKFLDQLEKPATKLHHYSLKKDPRAKKYTEGVFNACFQCHQTHRKNPYLD